VGNGAWVDADCSFMSALGLARRLPA